jgi:large subunit ribosomal protein L25
MSTAALQAEPRTELGTTNSRRLRRQGLIPGNIFGLDKEAEAVSISADTLNPVVQSGAHVIDVTVGDSVQKVVVREIQYDTFLTQILHIDLQRIDPNAKVEVEVSIETRGVATEGVLEQPLHSVAVLCLPWLIPDKFSIRIGSLRIGDKVTVADLELPEGASIDLDDDTVVLRVSEAQEVEIVQEDLATGAQPEVIGQKDDDEES